MHSVMKHDFGRVPAPSIQRSTFDRSHGLKTAIYAGGLYPILVDEILPGDTVKLKCTLMGRIATLIFALMDNVFMDTFFFFVPNRLVWDNWEKMNGAQDNPDDSIDFLVPTLEISAQDPAHFITESIFDYMGLPVGVDYEEVAGEGPDDPIALPLRAYNLIYNAWFRDQNLQDSVDVPTDDGPDDPGTYAILNRGKRPDYFTSCLPWPQKGDAVSLPLGTTAPVSVFGSGESLGMTSNPAVATERIGFFGQAGTPEMDAAQEAYNVALGTVIGGVTPYSGVTNKVFGVTTDPAASGLTGIADLASATAATINQLRQAFMVQGILERDARGGTRYVELLRSHFGVVSPDFRLQRPEYLGGYSQRLDVRAVPQTSASPATPSTTDAQGNLAAYGVVASDSGFMKSFVEHGFVIGLVNIRADLTYQQGQHRMWNRRTRYDHYLPGLANLGEQAVLNKEIFFPNGSTATANGVFGYQERWSEYRFKNSQITGKMRSNLSPTITGSLDAWHLSEDFQSMPTLNNQFIIDAAPIERVVAVADEPHFIIDGYFNMQHTRPMPAYSVPGMIGRF